MDATANPSHARRSPWPQLRMPRGAVELVVSANVSALGHVDAIYAATYLQKGSTCLGYLSTTPNQFEILDPEDATDSHSIRASVTDYNDRTRQSTLYAAIDITPSEATRIREWLKGLPL